MNNEFTNVLGDAVSKLTLVKLNSLKPIEKVMPTHLQYISSQIEQTQYINKPLIIDKNHHIILDGSHRYAYLKSKGYSYAPVILVDYDSNLIGVGTNLMHRLTNQNNSTITKNDIIKKALNNELFEPRTTRHFFPFKKSDNPIQIDKLIKTQKQCIDYLISNTTIEEEIICNQNYINEIENELKIEHKCTQEQLQTKKYLQNQINNMEKLILNPL